MFIRLLWIVLMFLVLVPIYAIDGNVLWIEKGYGESEIYVYSNRSLTDTLLNSGNSCIIEYDVYLERYEAIGRYDDVVLIDVSLNVQDQSNNLYYICIDGNGDGNGVDLWTNMIGTGNTSKYTINDFLNQNRHVKMIITKVNDTNYRVEAYIDNDLIGYKNADGNLTKVRVFFFGSVADDVSFKMAVDNIKITLPNGKTIYEDFEDDDWTNVISDYYKRGNDANYTVAQAFPVKTPEPFGSVVLLLVLIPKTVL